MCNTSLNLSKFMQALRSVEHLLLIGNNYIANNILKRIVDKIDKSHDLFTTKDYKCIKFS